MFQNIKVDIVYYNTNTDFEMEFNLCGCCRMRLLTDKSPDQKTFVHSLARAVSRSRIIIIVGSLFGESGITHTVASAIGSQLEVLNNKNYGISSSEEINIIKNSTPLITPDGIFGGCIIESGPQSMILLSESKSIRKSVMQTLIHPYIEELCAEELKEKASSEKSDFESSDKTTEITETDQDVQDMPTEAVDTSIETTEEDVSLSEGMMFEEEEIENSTEETQEDENKEETFDDTTESEIDNLNLNDFADSYDEDLQDNGKNDELPVQNGIFSNLQYDVNEYPNKRSKKFNFPILILSAILLVVLAILCYCIFYIPSKDGISADLYIKEIFNTLFS